MLSKAQTVSAGKRIFSSICFGLPPLSYETFNPLPRCLGYMFILECNHLPVNYSSLAHTTAGPQTKEERIYERNKNFDLSSHHVYLKG